MQHHAQQAISEWRLGAIDGHSPEVGARPLDPLLVRGRLLSARRKAKRAQNGFHLLTGYWRVPMPHALLAESRY